MSKTIRNFNCLWFLIFASVCCNVGYCQTAQEIIERSNVAMAPPIKFTMEVNGTVSVIHIKKLADNQVASRILSSKSKISCISIGSDCFEIYPDLKLIVDRSFLASKSKGDVVTILQEMGNPSLYDDYKISADEVFSAIPCWKLSRVVNPHVMMATLKHLTKRDPGKMMPSTIETFIAKDTYRLVGKLVKFETGNVSITRYSQFEPLGNVQDEFFLPPPDYEKVIPKSISEYSTFLLNMASKRRMPIEEMRVARSLTKINTATDETETYPAAVVSSLSTSSSSSGDSLFKWIIVLSCGAYVLVITMSIVSTFFKNSSSCSPK